MSDRKAEIKPYERIVPQNMDTTNCYLRVIKDVGVFHLSWEVGKDKVLAVEYVHGQYPAGGFKVFDSKDEYLTSIAGNDWIMEEINEEKKKEIEAKK